MLTTTDKSDLTSMLLLLGTASAPQPAPLSCVNKCWVAPANSRGMTSVCGPAQPRPCRDQARPARRPPSKVTTGRVPWIVVSHDTAYACGAVDVMGCPGVVPPCPWISPAPQSASLIQRQHALDYAITRSPHDEPMLPSPAQTHPSPGWCAHDLRRPASAALTKGDLPRCTNLVMRI
jgi:hypothetical protein